MNLKSSDLKQRPNECIKVRTHRTVRAPVPNARFFTKQTTIIKHIGKNKRTALASVTRQMIFFLTRVCRGGRVLGWGCSHRVTQR